MPSSNTPQRKALYLTMPSVVIALYAILALPWLLATRNRLDNDYWEAQLLFAFVVLVIAACGVPFVFARLFFHLRVLSILGWIIITLGYVGLLTYMIQSHYPPVTKLVCMVMGFVCLLWAVEGLLLDLKIKEWSLCDVNSMEPHPKSNKSVEATAISPPVESESIPPPPHL